MEKNIGKTDRYIRFIIGAVIIVAGAQLESVWGIVGILPIITSQMGICPLYKLLGISTVSANHLKKKRA